MKPLVIQIREAKAGIVESINTAIRGGIPCYLLEPIIAELHREVSKGAEAEYAQAVKQQAEEVKTETDGEDNGS